MEKITIFMVIFLYLLFSTPRETFIETTHPNQNKPHSNVIVINTIGEWAQQTRSGSFTTH